jgi:hypothetical protein
VLVGVGAAVFTIGGLLLFVLGPASPLIRILEVCQVAVYAGNDPDDQRDHQHQHQHQRRADGQQRAGGLRRHQGLPINKRFIVPWSLRGPSS